MIIKVPDAYEGKRVSTLLQKENGVSNKLLQHLKYKAHGITKNGEDVRANDVLGAGDVLTLDLSEAPKDNLLSSGKKPQILYESETVVVLNKPAQTPTHPSGSHRTDSAANMLAAYYGSRFTFHPVGRLDADTTGVLLAAKDPYTAAQLQSGRKEGKVRKIYVALTTEAPEKEEGILRSYLKISDDGLKVLVSETEKEGYKEARTAYRVLNASENGAVIAARTLTGRTHQIRAQFAAVGCPLIGDILYGSKDRRLPRHALHAYRMIFPQDGQEVRVLAPLPDDFSAIMQQIGIGKKIDLDDFPEFC